MPSEKNDSAFDPLKLTADQEAQLKARYGLSSGYDLAGLLLAMDNNLALSYVRVGLAGFDHSKTDYPLALKACRAALAYDQEIQAESHKGESWVGSDELDVLYEKWINLSRQALGIEATSGAGSPAEDLILNGDPDAVKPEGLMRAAAQVPRWSPFQMINAIEAMILADRTECKDRRTFIRLSASFCKCLVTEEEVEEILALPVHQALGVELEVEP